MPTFFQELGCEVVAFGKVGINARTAEYGFDRVDNIGNHEDFAIPNGVNWLPKRHSDKPPCLLPGANWPHVPGRVTGEGYLAERVRLPPNHADTPAPARESRGPAHKS